MKSSLRRSTRCVDEVPSAKNFTGDQKRFRNNYVRLARTASGATPSVDAADPGGKRLNSRRKFLQTSSLALPAFVATSVSARRPAQSKQTGHLVSRRDYWNDLPEYLSSKVNAARTARKTQLARVKSRAQADERASRTRETVWELIGGKLEKTPLNARTTGSVERNGYRIEKVIFESQPEFYVPAHLYLPTSGSKPFPAILAPVGHAPQGKTYASYQTLFQNLARQGFAVLTWDPPGQGERLLYLDASRNRSLFGPTGEHDRFGWPALLVGSTTTQFEAWDGVRALDYLLSRSEVDSKRIGCCGHSGGGTQTMYLCALDPRITAAVVVEGNTENLAGANYQPPGAYADAEQNIIGGLKQLIDRGDLLAAFAPKPLMICYTPVDVGTTYSPHYLEGTEEIVAELKSIYGTYDSREKITLVSSPLPHDYDFFQRAATYRWFGRWLLNQEQATDEVAFEQVPEASLGCTPTGQVLTSLGGRAAFQVTADRLRALKSQNTGIAMNRDQVQSKLRGLLQLPSERTPIRGQALSTSRYRTNLIEEIEFESEPGIRVPGWLVKPAGAAKYPVVVMTEDAGKDTLFEQHSTLDKITALGAAVCAVDLRTCGVTRPRLPSAGPMFYGDAVELAYATVNLSVGYPIVGQQTWDVLRCIDYLVSRTDIDAGHIGLLATGVTGIPALAAATLDTRIRALMLRRTIADLESVVASEDYKLPLSAVAFGMLRSFDLPDLCATVAPRAVCLLNTVGPQNNPLSLTHTRRTYSTAIRAYEAVNQPDELSFQIMPEPNDDAVLEWARRRLLEAHIG
jgi:cephalosporin-C deacetylase-like acetyl esterase